MVTLLFPDMVGSTALKHQLGDQGGVALFRAADGVATVTAGVEEHLRLAAFVTDDDDAVFAHVGLEEIAWVGDLRFVAHEIPAAGEDPFQLKLVDRLVRQHAPVEQTRRRIEQGQDAGPVPSVAQLRPS